MKHFFLFLAFSICLACKPILSQQIKSSKKPVEKPVYTGEETPAAPLASFVFEGYIEKVTFSDTDVCGITFTKTVTVKITKVIDMGRGLVQMPYKGLQSVFVLSDHASQLPKKDSYIKGTASESICKDLTKSYYRLMLFETLPDE
ncbi:hypothetical protein [Ascidiimonas aurantiaca]|uniref:hypothetical protein n=1 Tax=Ascidiimonas aurantiaca TaxID=1685432 RepID=UPI0030EC25AA